MSNGVMGVPSARRDLSLDRWAQNSLAVRWRQDMHDGAPPSSLDLRDWTGTMSLYGPDRQTMDQPWYSQDCTGTSDGHMIAVIPAGVLAGRAWDARHAGIWRLEITKGGITLLLGGGVWRLGDRACDQILDLVTAGIPEDMVLARHETQVFAEEAASSAYRAEDAASHASSSAIAAQASADRAAEWVHAGAGVLISPEPPAKSVGTQVWLVESSAPRQALYPSAGTSPGASTYPQRVGLVADGRHVITAVRQRVPGKDWTDYTFAPDLSQPQQN